MTANNTTTNGPVDGAAVLTGGYYPMKAEEIDSLLSDLELMQRRCERFDPDLATGVMLKLIATIRQLQRTYGEEVDEFNAGCEAYERGLDVDEAESMGEFPHDQFRCGYAWAQWDHLKTENAQLQTELADVRREVAMQCAPEQHAGGFYWCVSCGETHRKEAEQISHSPNCIYDQCRQALAATPTAGDAASDSAGEG